MDGLMNGWRMVSKLNLAFIPDFSCQEGCTFVFLACHLWDSSPNVGWSLPGPRLEHLSTPLTPRDDEPLILHLFPTHGSCSNPSFAELKLAETNLI
jgi:hypothetical protein